MTLHYHGTPITPLTALMQLAGRHLCVSFFRPEQVERAHNLAQSVMLDNGAFSAWRLGRAIDWTAYYAWAGRWLDYPTTWAVIPDVITGTGEDQDALIAQWPLGERGAPVWHMHEPIGRLVGLCERWPRVCIGSSAQYARVMSPIWQHRIDEAWNAIGRGRAPWVHMLRGMQCATKRWPFASLDSTDIARNHNRPQNTPRGMADRWDAQQCPGRWTPQPLQTELVA